MATLALLLVSLLLLLLPVKVLPLARCRGGVGGRIIGRVGGDCQLFLSGGGGGGRCFRLKLEIFRLSYLLLFILLCFSLLRSRLGRKVTF